MKDKRYRLLTDKRLVTGHDVLCCPKCRHEYAAPFLVEVNAGGNVTTVDSEQTSMSVKPPSGRGVRIGIGFTCEECDGAFTVAFQFHKGWTLVDVLTSTDAETGNRSVIWRD